MNQVQDSSGAGTKDNSKICQVALATQKLWTNVSPRCVWNKAFLLIPTYLFTLQRHYLYLSTEKRRLIRMASNANLTSLVACCQPSKFKSNFIRYFSHRALSSLCWFHPYSGKISDNFINAYDIAPTGWKHKIDQNCLNNNIDDN